MKTMGETYGEGETKIMDKHLCCDKCGMCINCRDCDTYGCGTENVQKGKKWKCLICKEEIDDNEKCKCIVKEKSE